MSEENKNVPGTDLELHQDPAQMQLAALRAAQLHLAQRAAADDRHVYDLREVGRTYSDPPYREAIGGAERPAVLQSEAQQYRDQHGHIAVEHVALPPGRAKPTRSPRPERPAKPEAQPTANDVTDLLVETFRRLTTEGDEGASAVRPTSAKGPILQKKRQDNAWLRNLRMRNQGIDGKDTARTGKNPFRGRPMSPINGLIIVPVEVLANPMKNTDKRWNAKKREMEPILPQWPPEPTDMRNVTNGLAFNAEGQLFALERSHEQARREAQAAGGAVKTAQYGRGPGIGNGTGAYLDLTRVDTYKMSPIDMAQWQQYANLATQFHRPDLMPPPLPTPAAGP